MFARLLMAQDSTVLMGMWAEAKAKGDEDDAEFLELLFGLPGESEEERERAIETARQVSALLEGAPKLPGPEHE